METATADETFMRQMYLVAARSKDPSTHIGAVLVKDGDVISSGWNGFGRKVLDTPERWNDKETKYKFVCHAEFNAIMNAARKGISTIGTILYTNGVPCNECAKAVVQAGVIEIVVHRQWPILAHRVKWNEAHLISDQMFSEVGIPVRWYDKLLNSKGFIDGKEVTV